jgi:hypothetical protein
MFGLFIRPSSGGTHAVLCALTRLDTADVRSLIVWYVALCHCRRFVYMS